MGGHLICGTLCQLGNNYFKVLIALKAILARSHQFVDMVHKYESVCVCKYRCTCESCVTLEFLR